MPRLPARLRRRNTQRVILYVVLLAASVLAFLRLAEDYVTNDPIVRMDRSVARWLHAHTTGPLVDVLEAVTAAGSTIFLAAATLTAGALLAARRRFSGVLLLLLVFVGGALVNVALKHGFERPRPPFADELAGGAEGFSFPSGHANVSIAVYGALVIVMLRDLASRAARIACVVAAVVLVTLIGFSRLYLGAHYLSDVLAGFAAGIAWLMLCLLAVAAYEARSSLRRREKTVVP